MSLSEFDIIDRYFSNVGSTRNDVILSVGDDCAVLSPNKDDEIVVTIDSLVQDIHFDASTPVDSIGYKAVMVSVSDLAAMGAKPAWLTLALTLPNSEHQWLKSFSSGLREACEMTGISLVGGNISRGPLNISTHATGLIKKGQAIRRSGAKPGDAIYVTGNIGEAGLGLMIHQQKLSADAFDQETKTYLLSRLFKPTARYAIAERLRSIATSCIDISDGLAADLGHLLSASRVGASVELCRLPVHNNFRTLFDQVGQWQSPISSGEDYELCFTASEKNLQQIQQISNSLDVKITQIGHIEVQSGLRFTVEGEVYQPAGCDINPGYRHF